MGQARGYIYDTVRIVICRTRVPRAKRFVERLALRGLHIGQPVGHGNHAANARVASLIGIEDLSSLIGAIGAVEVSACAMRMGAAGLGTFHTCAIGMGAAGVCAISAAGTNSAIKPNFKTRSPTINIRNFSLVYLDKKHFSHRLLACGNRCERRAVH